MPLPNYTLPGVITEWGPDPPGDPPVTFIGSQGNLWNNASVAPNEASPAIDVTGVVELSIIGTTDVKTTLSIELSLDNMHFYESLAVPGTIGDFVIDLKTAVPWVRIRSSAACVITASLGGKS